PATPQHLKARPGAGRPRPQLQPLRGKPLAVPLRHAHPAVGDYRLDRHLDPAGGVERRHLRRPGGGRPPHRRGGQRPLHRGDRRGPARPRRPVVLRRVLRDLASARIEQSTMSAFLAHPMSDDASSRHPIDRIVALARGWSLEATAPTDLEIAALRTLLRPRTQVYLTAVPRRDPLGQIEDAAKLAAAGFLPVPHVAVRNFATRASLEDYLARM